MSQSVTDFASDQPVDEQGDQLGAQEFSIRPIRIKARQA
jgi:hypothetical protein